MTFSTLGLSEPLLRAVSEKGYDTPSPIQAQAIPVILNGGDIMASAQTGTGKTAGFTLPLLQRLSSRPKAKNNHALALVLTPTRELAAQVHESVLTYGKHLNLRSAVVFGGVKINPQMMKLRAGVEILVATPGRLLDLYQQNAVKFQDLEVLVLDEADRMLDMGFIHDIKKILALLPKQRQNLLFSATFSDEIRELAKGLLHDPVEISVAPRNTTAEAVQQKVHPVDKGRKSELLSHLIHSNNWHQALVFSKTKHGANKLVKQLADKNINAAAIHGNKSQAQRTKALADFKQGKVQILVATDIAARGIDIDQLPQVVNYDLPNVPEDYVHRIGRTGRAGADGQAVSLVSADEFKQLQDIERLIKRHIDREDIPGFEPTQTLAVSRINGGGQSSPSQVRQTNPGRRQERSSAPRDTRRPHDAPRRSADAAHGDGRRTHEERKATDPQRRQRSRSHDDVAGRAPKEVNGNTLEGNGFERGLPGRFHIPGEESPNTQRRGTARPGAEGRTPRQPGANPRPSHGGSRNDTQRGQRRDHQGHGKPTGSRSQHGNKISDSYGGGNPSTRTVISR